MRFVKIGYVAGSFGTAGALKIKPVTEHPELIYNSEFLLLSSDCENVAKSLKVLSVEPHGDFFVIKCSGVGVRGKSDELKGMSLVIPEDKLPVEDDDEIYWYRIAGSDVKDSGGNILGTLTDYIETGTHDVFRIKLNDGSYALISNNKTHVLSINGDERFIVIEPAGLVREDV